MAYQQHGNGQTLCIYQYKNDTAPGWGLLNQFPPFRYFPNFSSLLKHNLAVKHCVTVWQVSPQLSCGDTCQIGMWFDEYNTCFCNIENFAYGEINERRFSNHHPRMALGKTNVILDIFHTLLGILDKISLPLYLYWRIYTDKLNDCSALQYNKQEGPRMALGYIDCLLQRANWCISHSWL